MAWKAQLRGDGLDLETLAELFPGPDPRVQTGDDGQYYVESTRFTDLPDASAVMTEADSLLLLLNGLARTADFSYRPVRLTGQFAAEDGRLHAVVIANSAELRMKASSALVSVDGEVRQPPSPREPIFFSVALRKSEATEALSLLANDRTDWSCLYKVYEIVRHDLTNEKEMLSTLKWLTKADLSAFTGSANHPEVSGEGARHARLGGGRPRRTMTLNEGRAFAARLVRTWLETKVDESDAGATQD